MGSVLEEQASPARVSLEDSNKSNVLPLGEKACCV